jgi:hypothetical protein
LSPALQIRAFAALPRRSNGNAAWRYLPPAGSIHPRGWSHAGKKR